MMPCPEFVMRTGPGAREAAPQKTSSSVSLSSCMLRVGPNDSFMTPAKESLRLDCDGEDLNFQAVPKFKMESDCF